MKSILLSIKPKYAELIARGEKTIEVRKTAPKEVPFKCYIYMTQGTYKDLGLYSEGIYQNRMKVIGEFICDKVDKYEPQVILCAYYEVNGAYVKENLRYNSGTCLSYEDMVNYSKGKTLYGWHIFDLKIYDKPKGLNEFYRMCKNPCKPSNGGILCLTTKTLKMNGCDGKIPLTRPPQSYMFVEEVEQ